MGNNQTTTDNDLKFNGNKLTVKDFECTGSFTANISALVPTLAQNVAGSGGRVLYNSSTNNTSDSGNLTFDGTNLSCGGNITAYSSDIRLKTEIHTIENAVAKVCMLKGFTYQWNDLAKEEMGFDTEERISGVSAQDVQNVLPEAVKPAPANDKYLTVQYEKLVPLLIESIKELKSEIDQLRHDKADRITKNHY